MALIPCPECTKQVSSRALSCPHCGFPVRDEQHGPEEVLFEASPKLFGGNWFVHAVVIVLCFALVGFFVYLHEWLKQRATRIVVSNRRTTLREGILDRRTNEVRHSDVRNVRVEQTLVQRMFGVGKIEISSAGQSDVEIALKGIPDPQHVADMIREQRG
ncbi:MAG: PH domain-containing protein [Sandaracinaceae bacterium]